MKPNFQDALAIALANLPTMILILVGLLYNNRRLDDVKEALRAEIRAGNAELKASFEVRLTRLEDKVDRFEGQRIIP